MAWIEFHPVRIIRLKKFHDFRKEIGWSVPEALGYLGMFWGHAIEVCEDGDVSSWGAEYLAEIMGFKIATAERMFDCLRRHSWVDSTGNQHLIHDWLDFAGTFLRGKYSNRNRERLRKIWALHGKIYGDANRQPIGSISAADNTLPNLTIPIKKIGADKPPRPKFVKPTAEQVAEYAKKIGFPLDGQLFVDHYESNGWLIGRAPMKDWQATVRTWKKKQSGFASQQPKAGPSYDTKGYERLAKQMEEVKSQEMAFNRSLMALKSLPTQEYEAIHAEAVKRLPAGQFAAKLKDTLLPALMVEVWKERQEVASK